MVEPWIDIQGALRNDVTDIAPGGQLAVTLGFNALAARVNRPAVVTVSYWLKHTYDTQTLRSFDPRSHETRIGQMPKYI